VRGNEPPPLVALAPIARPLAHAVSMHPRLPLVIPTPPPSFLRRQEPTRQAVRVLAPNLQRRRSGWLSRRDAKTRTKC